MKPVRKLSEESAKTRDAILDATETIMCEEGYAAVSSRRVAEKAGLKSKLVHYYFETMDELFIAVYKRYEEGYLRQLEMLNPASPLRALWDLSVHPKRTTMSLEMIALSNHRKSIRKMIAQTMEQMHKLQIAAIAKYIAKLGLDPKAYPPTVLSYLISGVARILVTETAMGDTNRHAEVLAFAERFLKELEIKGRARVPVAQA